MKLSHLCILMVALFAVGVVLMPRDNTLRSDWRTFGPQGELKEIIVWGFYTRESEQEVQDAHDDLKWYLKEGQSVVEKFPHLNLGEEKYNRSGQRFCDHVTDEETKKKYPIINPNLRVRLYDREGDVLSEDFARDEFPKNTDEMSYRWHVIAHVPYHEEGHSLRLVRLEDGKEILLEQLEFHSAQKLWREVEEGEFYAYLISDDGCFISPPMR